MAYTEVRWYIGSSDEIVTARLDRSEVILKRGDKIQGTVLDAARWDLQSANYSKTDPAQSAKQTTQADEAAIGGDKLNGTT